MVFNFPPSRVQQRSIPKLESCTVYPGWARETLPQSQGKSGVKWLVQRWLAEVIAEVPALRFLFSFCWQDVVVAVCLSCGETL